MNINMPTCKFFIKGMCKYGDNCRFNHSQGSGGMGGSDMIRAPVFGGNFGFSNQGQNQNYQQHHHQQQQQQHGKDPVLSFELQIKQDMLEWDSGKIWPLSTYGFSGGKASIPGFHEFSAEEIRWETYASPDRRPPYHLAKNIEENIAIRHSFLQPQTTPSNRQLIEMIIKGEKPISRNLQEMNNLSSTGLFGQNPVQSNAFGFNQQGASMEQSAFAQQQQQQQLHLQQQQQPQQQSLFGNQGFATGGFQTQPQQNSFQQPQQAQALPFGGGFPSATPNANSFSFSLADNKPQEKPFGSPFGTPFGQTSPQQQQQQFQQQKQQLQPLFIQQNLQPGFQKQPNLQVQFQSVPQAQQQAFQNLSTSFGGNTNASGNPRLPGEEHVYSLETDLTPEEIGAYKANVFSTADSIPLKPPPKHFCI